MLFRSPYGMMEIEVVSVVPRPGPFRNLRRWFLLWWYRRELRSRGLGFFKYLNEQGYVVAHDPRPRRAQTRVWN